MKLGARPGIPRLASGPVDRHVRDLAIPASVGFFFHTMYNVVDTWFAGLISTTALAALSLSFPVFFILIAFGSGTSTGVTALIGNGLGEDDHETAARFAAQGISFGLCLALAITVLGIVASPAMFRFLGAEEEYLDICLEYMVIIFAGSPVFLLVHMFNASLNAVGNTRPYRNFLIMGFFLNLGLDPWFVFGGLGVPPMGVGGIALATVLILAAGAVYLWRKALSTGLFDGTRPGDYVPDLRVFRQIAAQAMPASLNMLTVCVGIFVITWFVSRFGQEAVAAYGVGVRIEQIALLPSIGLNVAALALSAQNRGAGRYDRVRESVRICLVYGAWCMAIGGAGLLLLADPLVALFTNDAAVARDAVSYLRIAAVTLYSYVLLYVNVSALQGLKKPMFALWIGLYRQLAAPVAMFWLLAVGLGLGVVGVWWGIFVVTWTAALVAVWYFRRKLPQVEREHRDTHSAPRAGGS